MKDDLGDRIKNNYEYRTRYMLPRRTYTIIRLDGKAFHTFTRGLDKPFDKGFMINMSFTAHYLLREIQGAKLAYTQSDEISLLLTDFDDIKTDAWFDGNLQKICSVSASMATAFFNHLYKNEKLALFDSRVFTISDKNEVANYFVWRTKDALRNSLQALAQSLYSPKELYGKGYQKLHDMLHQKGVNWNDLDNREKNGSLYIKKPIVGTQGLLVQETDLFNFYVKLVENAIYDTQNI